MLHGIAKNILLTLFVQEALNTHFVEFGTNTPGLIGGIRIIHLGPKLTGVALKRFLGRTPRRFPLADTATPHPAGPIRQAEP